MPQTRKRAQKNKDIPLDKPVEPPPIPNPSSPVPGEPSTALSEPATTSPNQSVQRTRSQPATQKAKAAPTQLPRVSDKNHALPRPPTKASEERAQKQRERNREQRLAHNLQEDAIFDLSTVFESIEGSDHQIESPLQMVTPSFIRGSPLSPQYAAFNSEIHSTWPSFCFTSHPKKTLAQDVWFFFTKATAKNRLPKTTCKLCEKQGTGDGLYAPSTSCGILHDHLTRLHPVEYLEACHTNGWKPQGKLKHINISDPDVPVSLPCFPFTIAQFRMALVAFIVGFDESINVVECPEFRTLLLTLRDTLEEKDIPHRTTVRRLIASMYKDQFARLIVELRMSQGKISLTVDGWDDKSMRAYVAVTAHFLRRINDSRATHA
ncbi:hypothetical protein M422DRAFT_270285 [Sphaerobolus stellatus SS14]|uniref:BED-type domain-containing protein n=1 Tax=Sphaerobolus stellatus (strain SS14) TaxID=990650 RepID=A0A0C9UTE6_SPHS4|nr:hypothetical protein M422DRAFT_270285 [Sphaerobolus stellatus SS14]